MYGSIRNNNDIILDNSNNAIIDVISRSNSSDNDQYERKLNDNNNNNNNNKVIKLIISSVFLLVLILGISYNKETFNLIKSSSSITNFNKKSSNLSPTPESYPSATTTTTTTTTTIIHTLEPTEVTYKTRHPTGTSKSSSSRGDSKSSSRGIDLILTGGITTISSPTEKPTHSSRSWHTRKPVSESPTATYDYVKDMGI